MSHIFISYSRKDIDFAQKIVDALAANKLDTWIDWKSIPKGEKWLDEIYRGVEGADAFIFLISPDSVISKNCNKEIEHAVTNKKRIIPIVVRDTDPKIVHLEILKRNWIFCRDGQDDFSKAIEEARKTIHTDYEWLKYHTELQVKALKWEQEKDNSRLLRGKELQEAEQQFAKVSAQADPQPTKIQREYILASQRNEVRARRQVTLSLGVGLAIFALLAVLAWIQRNTAVTEANSRATAESNAVAEANFRATAQADAKEQANVALARQWAAQAASLTTENNKDLVPSMLLATASHSRVPNLQADQILREGFAYMPVLELNIATERIFNVDFDPSQQWVLYNERYDGNVKVWNVNKHKEVSYKPWGENILCSYFIGQSQIISTLQNGDVVIWDFETGHLINSWNSTTITCAVLSPDKKLALLVSPVTLQVREIQTGQILFEKSRPETLVDVSFSPNHQLLAVGTKSGDIFIWETERGREVSHLFHPSGLGCNFLNQYRCLAFSPDGHLVASGGNDGILRIWDIKAEHETASKLYGGSVSDISFNPNGTLAASVSGCCASVWNFFTDEELLEIKGLPNHIKFSPDGNRIVVSDCKEYAMGAGCVDHSIQVLDLATKREIVRMIGDGDIVDFAFSADGNQLVSATNTSTGSFRVWDITEGAQKLLISNADSITSVAIGANPDHIFLAGNKDSSGYVDVWDITKPSKSFSFISENKVSVVKASIDGRIVVSGGDEDRFTVWDSLTRNILMQTQSDDFLISLSPDGKLLGTSNKGCLNIIEISTGNLVSALSCGHSEGVDSMEFSPDNNFLVLSGFDNAKGIYYFKELNIASGKEILNREAEKNRFLAVFSKTGDTLFSAEGGSLKTWDVKSGKNIATISYETIIGGIVDISRDGLWILSVNCEEIGHGGCHKSTVRVWNASTGQELARKLYGGSVGIALFGPESKWVVSGSAWANAMDVWLWQPDDMISGACHRLPRNLTTEEWNRYIGDNIPYQATCPNLPITEE